MLCVCQTNSKPVMDAILGREQPKSSKNCNTQGVAKENYIIAKAKLVEQQYLFLDLVDLD